MANKFVFLILPQLHLMDLAGPDQIIHEAAEFGKAFNVEYCGLETEVLTSAGLPIQNLSPYQDIRLQAGDYLIIPGPRLSYLLSAEFKKQRNLMNWLQSCYQQKISLVSICTGAFVLGLAGLLDGCQCTTHFQCTAQLQSMFPQAKVKENVLFVEDQGIHTSAGISSGIDLMLHLIEQLTDSYFAHKVAREMVVYNRREGSSAQLSVFMQFRNHIHAGIHQVQDHLIEHVHSKHSLADLCKIACMSERNFTRIFKKETGITVNNYITLIRRETILNLIKNRDLTLAQISRQVGLESEKQVKRIIAGTNNIQKKNV